MTSSMPLFTRNTKTATTRSRSAARASSASARCCAVTVRILAGPSVIAMRVHPLVDIVFRSCPCAYRPGSSGSGDSASSSVAGARISPRCLRVAGGILAILAILAARMPTRYVIRLKAVPGLTNPAGLGWATSCCFVSRARPHGRLRDAGVAPRFIRTGGGLAVLPAAILCISARRRDGRC